MINCRSEEVPIPFLGGTVMNAGANLQMWPQVAVAEGDLDGDRRSDGVVGAWEDRGETVTGGSKDLSPPPM
jgi:hypothetical protein